MLNEYVKVKMVTERRKRIELGLTPAPEPKRPKAIVGLLLYIFGNVPNLFGN